MGFSSGVGQKTSKTGCWPLINHRLCICGPRRRLQGQPLRTRGLHHEPMWDDSEVRSHGSGPRSPGLRRALVATAALVYTSAACNERAQCSATRNPCQDQGSIRDADTARQDERGGWLGFWSGNLRCSSIHCPRSIIRAGSQISAEPSGNPFTTLEAPGWATPVCGRG